MAFGSYGVYIKALVLWLSLTLQTISAAQTQIGPPSLSTSAPIYQGKCPVFVQECYKTCFSLRQPLVAYACTYKNDLYAARCICGGSIDQTQVVLNKAQIPVAVTTTLSTVTTQNVLVTDLSTASTTTTATATFKASVCSSTTIISTIYTTATLTAPPSTVTTTVTTVTTSTSTFIASAVSGAVVSSGSSGSAKRAISSFCPDIQLACKVGCAAFLSTPTSNICQAISAGSSKFSVACICKNNVNVLQQIIQGYNLLRTVGNRITQISATTVAATSTSTFVAISTVMTTQTTVVVPTTVVSIITSSFTLTSTYACPTTVTTAQPVTATTETPTTTATTTTTLTSVTVQTMTAYNIAFSAPGAQPSYVAQSKDYDNYIAGATTDKSSAQVFVVIPSALDPTVNDILGIGPGDFSAQYITASPWFYVNDYTFYFFNPLPFTSSDMTRQGTASNVWKVDPLTMGITISVIAAGSNTRTDLQAAYAHGRNILGAVINLEAGEQNTGLGYYQVNIALVPA